jgi:hypothetical protein
LSLLLLEGERKKVLQVVLLLVRENGEGGRELDQPAWKRGNNDED